MFKKNNIECIIGIKNIECLEILFSFLSREECIDKIILAFHDRTKYNAVAQIIKNFPALRQKAQITIRQEISVEKNILLHIAKNTIYIYIEDDICYLMPDAIKNMIAWHIERQNILSFPAIINTGITTFIHQIMGIIPIFKGMDAEWGTYDYHGHDNLNLSESNVYSIHKKFVESTDDIDTIKFNNYYLCQEDAIYKQFYIWHGDNDVARTRLEEQRAIHPERFCINGDIFVSHYSFKKHKNVLDKSSLLNIYKNISKSL